MPKERPYKYSWSELEQYDRCPLAWRRQKKGEGGPPDPALTFGSAFHSFAQLYGQHCQTTKRTTDIASIDMWAKKAAAEWGLNVELTQSLADLANSFGRQMIFPKDSLFENVLQLDHEGKPFSVFQENAHFGCTLDAWWMDENTYHVLDYKTNRYLPPASNFDMLRQPVLYAACLMKYQLHPTVTQATAHLHFVRYAVERTFTIHREEGDDIISEALERALDIEQAVTDDNFEPRPGPQCATCSFIRSCVAHAGLPENERIMLDSPEAATKAAEQLHLLNALSDQYLKALKSYADEHGMIQFGKREMGYYAVEERSYHSAKAVLAELHKAGVSKEDIMTHLSLAKGAVDGIIKGVTAPRSAQRKELRAAAEQHLSSEFVTKFKTKVTAEE